MTGYTMICAVEGKTCPHLRLCMPTGVCLEGARTAQEQETDEEVEE